MGPQVKCSLKWYTFLWLVHTCQENFRNFVRKDRFSKLKNLALKMFFMLKSTNICDNTFSVMKQAECNLKNRIADKTLNDCLNLLSLTLELPYKYSSIKQASIIGIPLCFCNVVVKF